MGNVGFCVHFNDDELSSQIETQFPVTCCKENGMDILK